MTDETTVLEILPPSALTVADLPIPRIVAEAGIAAAHTFEEFFFGTLRNRHTRRAYERAVRQFFHWLEPYQVPLPQITPGIIGRYFDEHPGSPPSRKLSLAALRCLFDQMVNRHIMLFNPAATVRGERYRVVEGKTPEIPIAEARKLFAGIDVTTLIGLRDRAVCGILAYTAARRGAVASLKFSDLEHDGTQSLLRFIDKGGRDRLIPVRHDLEAFLCSYIARAFPEGAPAASPLFRSAQGRTGTLTDKGISGNDVWRIVKRRLAGAHLAERLSPHSFRVTVITDLLTQGVSLEDAQHLAGHADPRTTRLYDRRHKAISRNIVERISI